MNMCFPSYLIQKRKLFSPFRYIFIVIFAIGFVHVYGQPSSLLNTTQTLPNIFAKENSIHQETSIQNETNNNPIANYFNSFVCKSFICST